MTEIHPPVSVEPRQWFPGPHLDEEPDPLAAVSLSSNCCRETIRPFDNEEDGGDGGYLSSAYAAEMLRDLLRSSAWPDLRSAVAEAAAEPSAQGLLKSSGTGYRRAVMAKLRERGYNAGLCKARWASSGTLTAGIYEYINVVMFNESTQERYIVDLDFAAQFEIARATPEYEKLVGLLPEVVTARVEEVKQALRAMAESAKRSLKKRELSMPSWRKRWYMMAKWFGPYRQTVNPLPASAGPEVAAIKAEMAAVKCRAIGFGPARPGPWGSVIAPAMTRM